MDKFKTDFHNHTLLSRCARKEMTVAAMIRKFEEYGLEQVGISDHLYPESDIQERFLATKKEVAEIETKVKVFVGTEVDMYYPGKLSAEKAVLDIFDYVMVGCTHYQLKDKIVPPLFFDYKTIAQNEYDFIMAATSLDFVDIIAHPFHARGLKEYREDFSVAEAINHIPDDAMKRIVKNMKENEIAIELNTVLLEEDYAKAMHRFYTMCKQEKIKFSLGSDAHWLDCIYEIPLIRSYLESLQITGEDIWTL